MANWIRIASLEDLPLDSATEHVALGQMIALFRTVEGVFALDGICPHQGGPLGKGAVDGCVVTCPWHGWQFDVRDGKHVTSPICQPQLPVRVDEAGDIHVDVKP